MTGDRHTRQNLTVRLSAQVWAMIDRRAAATGKPANQIARVLIKELLELELVQDREADFELEHRAEVDAAAAAHAVLKAEASYRFQELPTPPSYQQLAAEQDPNGVRFFYMGTNYVAFTPVEWAEFLVALAGWSTKEIRGGS